MGYDSALTLDGAWRSLVARTVRDRKVGGSNPLAPTILPPIPIMATQAKRIIVRGRVQGVGFRYFVQRVGNRLGVTGNVRNREDSSVEIVVEGNETLIEDFQKEIARGPALARVERVDADDITVTGKYRTFQIEGW
jgi:acylphosphatase